MSNVCQVLTCAIGSGLWWSSTRVKRAETPAAAATSNKKAKSTPAEREDPPQSGSNGNNDHSGDEEPEKNAGLRAAWQHTKAEEDRDNNSSKSEGDCD